MQRPLGVMTSTDVCLYRKIHIHVHSYNTKDFHNVKTQQQLGSIEHIFLHIFSSSNMLKYMEVHRILLGFGHLADQITVCYILQVHKHLAERFVKKV